MTWLLLAEAFLSGFIGSGPGGEALMSRSSRFVIVREEN